MKKWLSSVVTVIMMSAGVWLVLTPQAQAACNPFANTPTYSESSDILRGTGGHRNCNAGSGTTAEVLLRHDRSFAPDDTVAQGSGSGNFTRTLAEAGPTNGQFYTETRSQSGAKARSGNRSVG